LRKVDDIQIQPRCGVRPCGIMPFELVMLPALDVDRVTRQIFLAVARHLRLACRIVGVNTKLMSDLFGME
jgi:hypothetical protein